MGDSTTKFTKTILILTGLALTVPVLLVTALVLTLSGRLDGNQPPGGASQEYAKSFYMIIREQGQNIHIWARNLDSAPDFRQTIEVNGQRTTQQVYVSAEKALYTSQATPGQASQWSKTPNLEPKDIGLSNITSGPAVWALQNGVGDSQVQVQQGSLNITVKSVNQPIDDAVFKPDDAVELN